MLVAVQVHEVLAFEDIEGLGGIVMYMDRRPEARRLCCF